MPGKFSAKWPFFAKFKERSEKTYIFPTGFGFAFAAVCILLLGIAFASGNNLIYLFCFLMTAMASQSLILTNRMTEKVELSHIQIEDTYAEENLEVEISLKNTSNIPLYKIKIEGNGFNEQIIPHIPAHSEIRLRLSKKAPEFGVHRLASFTLSSSHPYEFARSWKKSRPALEYYIYPARKGTLQFPKGLSHDDILNHGRDDYEFKGHRPYQSSDSTRSLDWKVYARTLELMSKEYENLSQQRILFRAQDHSPEQLSLWLTLAERQQFEYGLELPDRRMALFRGPQHLKNCLRALTTYHRGLS